MADIYLFFKEGIKSYIEQSFSKYSKNTDIIFDKNFDNKFLHPLFINDISLYKNLIQKNKLKAEIWRLIGDLLDQKIEQILTECQKIIIDMKNKVLKYSEKIRKSNKAIEIYEEKIKETGDRINNIYTFNKNTNNENQNNKEEKEDLSDTQCKQYDSSFNKTLINDIEKYNRKIEEEKKLLKINDSKLKHREKYSAIGDINFLKIEIMRISLNILINEINNQELKNQNYNKENSYKLINDYICDFIDKSEKIKDIAYIGHYKFLRAYVIEEALIINLDGYKDINKIFLKQLLNSINEIKNKYSNSHISNLIKNIEKLISNPDTFLCPNAFQILKEASFKKIKPRSRNNSFDKNDLTNNNTNFKNEKNRKIDEYLNLNKEEKSDSDEDEEGYQKKLSHIISFRNSSIHNNNSNSNLIQNNINFQSQSSLGLIESNKYRSYPNESAFSNNSLIYLENHNGTNMLNSSKMSLDDSMSIQGLYRSGSCSELLGINSRLVSQLPSVRNTKQEKDKNNLEFKKKIKMKKIPMQRKNSNEKLDKIFRKEFRKMVNNNFYSNENEKNKEKNTTATETKKNLISEEKIDSKKTKSNILVAKTPIKTESENVKEKIKNEKVLKETGIKRNLELLFNQQTDK